MHGPPEDRRPPHPGEVFLERWLRPLGITQKEAAERLGISYPRMNEIVNGKRSVTPETALRLARFTDTEPEHWVDLQRTVDLWTARRAADADDIRKIEPAVAVSDRADSSPRHPPALPTSSEEARGSTERAARYGVVRMFELGAEPPDDLRAGSSAAQRLAMVEALTERSWRLAAAARRSAPPPRTSPVVEPRPGPGGDDP